MTLAGGALLDRIRSVVSRHPVEFAILFGSAAREDATETSDVDLAVEFDGGVRANGYSDAYLGLLTELEATLGVHVDVVPLSSISPRFASVIFEQGVVVHGEERRKDELAREIAGEPPSTQEARERVAAVVDRLTGGDS